MTDVYFADTYALIGMLTGVPAYARYRDCTLVTSAWNIAELYYFVLRLYGRASAEGTLRYLAITVGISQQCIRLGMQFKHAHRAEKLSYPDCIGYALAAEHGIPFLTGDEKFAGKPNVAFVR